MSSKFFSMLVNHGHIRDLCRTAFSVPLLQKKKFLLPLVTIIFCPTSTHKNPQVQNKGKRIGWFFGTSNFCQCSSVMVFFRLLSHWIKKEKRKEKKKKVFFFCRWQLGFPLCFPHQTPAHQLALWQHGSQIAFYYHQSSLTDTVSDWGMSIL